MDTFSRFIKPLLYTGVLFYSCNALASDDYLKMLEGEAEDVKLDQSGQLKEKKQVNTDSTGTVIKRDWIWEGDIHADKLPQGLAFDEFGALLNQHFYGTFVFYRKLNSIEQETVYHHYTQASVGDLDLIRKDILNQLKK